MFCYQPSAWSPKIGGYSSYEEAAKDFKDGFYYSPNAPYSKELLPIIMEEGVDPNDIEAVKNLFASFAISEY